MINRSLPLRDASGQANFFTDETEVFFSIRLEDIDIIISGMLHVDVAPA
jgi:hypothetical protein